MAISKYLRELREAIGTDLVMMPAATAVVFDQQGRVLLARSVEGACWVTPGGSADPGECLADAVIREVWEETGLLVEPLRVTGVYGGPDFRVTYANGDRVGRLVTAFECRLVGGDLRPDRDEVAELGCFSRDEIAGLEIAPWLPSVLEDAFSRDGNGGARFQASSWHPPADGVRSGGMSSYLQAVRQKVGHDLLLLPAVTGVIEDEEGRVLMQKRSDNGEWHLPAGAIEPDESPAQAVVREVWEETGLLVEPLRVTGVYGGPDFYVTYPNGDRIVVYSVVFECRVVGGRASPDGVESVGVCYFPPQVAQDLMPRRWWRRVAQALEGRPAAYFDRPTWQPQSLEEDFPPQA